jgi:hypothetical protein
MLLSTFYESSGHKDFQRKDGYKDCNYQPDPSSHLHATFCTPTAMIINAKMSADVVPSAPSPETLCNASTRYGGISTIVSRQYLKLV